MSLENAGFESMGAAIDALTDAGAKRLGSGWFGVVFTHPTNPDRVVKMGCDMSDGWPLYAAYAAASKSPALQRIHSFRWVRDEAGNRLYYRAEMERLEGTLADLTYNHPEHPLHERAHALLTPASGAAESALWMAKLEDLAPEAAAVLADMKQTFPGESWDTHGNNWMLRKDGALVLIDPFSDSDSDALETVHIDEAEHVATAVAALAG
jgi:hypothetical protein